MSRDIIIVTGYLATGKSTFALRLSKALGIPYFVKVDFVGYIETARRFIKNRRTTHEA